ncbi:MAG TPA: hypothetical protein VGP71_00055 [Burkholderiales bacterium]|nr:hypothetical protein [Burkholderiales bacterium]
MAPAVCAADELGLSFIETEDLRLIYFDPLGFLTPHTVRTFTNSLAWQKKIFGWTPSQKTTVLLKDFADYGNASAVPAPNSRLVFDVAPQSRAFETYPAGERMYTLMNHELVHTATADVASSEDRSWRTFFFGKVQATPDQPESLLYNYLTIPRIAAPRWLIEGIAVFSETWMNGGLGRAQSGYDEMVFREMVRDNAHFYDPLGLASRGARVDFRALASAYLYGTRFLTYLAYTRSPEKVMQWIRRDEGSKRYYADQFEHVFGLPIEAAWQEWVRFEQEFQRANLAEVRKHPVTPYRRLGAGAAGSISRLHYDEASGMLYGGFRYPGFVEHIGALNTKDGTLRRLADIKRPMHYRVTSFAFDPSSGTAFYTDDNLALRDLMAIDVKTGARRMLMEDARIGEIALNPIDKSLIGVRHLNGIATLVHIAPPYGGWKDLHTFPWEHVPSDLDISSDGRLLSATISDDLGEQYLRVWELAKVFAGDMKPLSEFKFGQSVPESFVFSRDGRYLYGSSYYTGVSNIYRYEVATGKIEALTNAESGFFRPMPLTDGRMLVLAYTSEGFVPAIIEPRATNDLSAIKFLGAELAAKHPVVTTWQVPPGTDVTYVKMTDRGIYYPPEKLSFVNAYPILQGYKDSIGPGYRINFEDPIRFASLSITAAVTPSGSLPRSEKAHLDIQYRYLGWRAGLAWNSSDFYDIFGPTKHSRKGFAAKVGYNDLLIYDEPRRLDLKSEIAYYDRLDTLPQTQNVTSSATRLRTGLVGMYYTDVRRSLGAVDDEKGLKWRAVLNGNLADGELTPLLRGDVDFGFDLPLAHSSIWLRNTAGVADGARTNPYANFFFGGFGNNYVDSTAEKSPRENYASEKRYREYYAFPGFDIGEISGRSFGRTMLEWNLPPYFFESAGTPAFHLAWLRPAVFASVLWTEPGNSSLRRRYTNLGAQADLRFSFLHWYEMTLSVGYAVGYRGGQRAGNEWMISLQIM